jgi:hydroxypyruvate isomerase
MSVIAGSAAGSLAATTQLATPAYVPYAAAAEEAPLKGNLKQSACKWCYSKMSLDELCQAAVKIGLKGIDLLGENDWATVKKYGLVCAMANGPSGINDGWNLPKDHDKLVAESERLLPLVAEAGLPNMIVFSGNRRGMDDKEGIKNCAKGLKKIMPLAEKLNVTVCMELLNSKHDHKDYQCDHTPWGAALVDEIGSPRFKLLYDIYHMQIMEGDVIATITQYKDYIAHFHTGGVPGRHEIDETQELNYRRICEAILANGFTGYLAQEFVPGKDKDPVASLTQCAKICDV